MSTFIGNPAIGCQCLGGHGSSLNDDSLQPVDYRVSLPNTRATPNQIVHADVLWPRSSLFGGDLSSWAPLADNMVNVWEFDAGPVGGRRRKIVTGQVLDGSNAPVAGATVDLFNAATKLLVDTGVSDAQGNYVLGDPNNVACFVVAYLTGSPDTAGTTLRTITGT